MTRYRVTFDRIGRNRQIAPLIVVADGVDDIEDAIHNYARGHLSSRFFDVHVNLDSRRVAIEANRFGSGRIEELPALSS